MTCLNIQLPGATSCPPQCCNITVALFFFSLKTLLRAELWNNGECLCGWHLEQVSGFVFVLVSINYCCLGQREGEGHTHTIRNRLLAQGELMFHCCHTLVEQTRFWPEGMSPALHHDYLMYYYYLDVIFNLNAPKGHGACSASSHHAPQEKV